MSRRLFDTNKLVAQLRRLGADSKQDDAIRLAKDLIETYRTNSIVTPVEIEVLAGVRDSHELQLTEAFLAQFDAVDREKFLDKDWREAWRIAKHVIKYDLDIPRRRKSRAREKNPKTPARDLGDCLITALARRLGYEVISDDSGLSRQAGRTAPG